VACIGVDIASFMALHVLSFASNLNYGALLVLPALMAGVLAARVQALATAAAVVLLNTALDLIYGAIDPRLRRT
jgi:two-component system sensor histidine kinase PilS (NtrC family)